MFCKLWGIHSKHVFWQTYVFVKGIILRNYLYVRRINQLFILQLNYTDDYNNVSFISRSYGFCTVKKLLKYLMKGGFSQLAVFPCSNIRIKLKKMYWFRYWR